MPRKKRLPMSVTHPALALEFHPNKNGELLPTEITAGTSKKLWWVCKKCEHEWQAPGARRKYRGSGCPACSNHTVHIDGRNSMRSMFPLLAAEFHLKKNGDLMPEKLLPGTNKRLWWKCSKCENEWIASGNDRRSGNGCPNCSGRAVHSDGRNSIVTTHPELVKELHPTKNHGLNFNQIRPGTDKKIWWKCRKCKHEWIAHGYQRTGPMNSGCPACANQAIHSDGRNSLKSRFPKLSEEWHKDNESLPEEVLSGSGKKAKWKCKKCDHDWSVRIVNRTGEKKSGCPACKNLEIHRDGRNSMTITHPHLVKELHPIKNKDVLPHEIVAGTGKKLWWLCSLCQHEWLAGGNSRIQGRGCPACSGKTVHSDGRNSMAVTHPELAAELHPTLNGRLTAVDVVAGTRKKLWWLCSICENEWEALRNSGKHGCPSCSSNRLHSDGRNSMAVTHPHLVKELHPTKNKDLSPHEMVAGTVKMLWWLCSVCQHEWKTKGQMRANKNGTGCPACSNTEVHVDGRNSLAMMSPQLVTEFHPIKNEMIKSQEILNGSEKRVWWLCKTCQHEWKTTPGNRTGGKKSGCPACSNHTLHIRGLNSLAVTHPDLAVEFHSEKNEGLTAREILSGSHKKIWWICNSCQHEWKTTPGSRSGKRKTGCPACAPTGFQPDLPGYYYVNKIVNIETQDILYYKAGISGDWKRRLEQLYRGLPSNMGIYNIEIIRFEIGQKALEIESRLKSISEIRAPRREFDGGDELFLINPLDYAREKDWL
jgi:Zn finger protein HypA/HybF involved in hydrogenase expression